MKDVANCERSCSTVLTKYYSGGPIKKNEMGRACGTYGEEDKCIQGVVWLT